MLRVCSRRRRGTRRALKETEKRQPATRVENEAKGDASRFEQILAEYKQAPEVTRRRLYIDAQEEILSSVSKVVVDQKGGNSLLYLPLDKLLAETGATKPSQPAASESTVTPNTMLHELEAGTQRSRDAMRSRERESR